MVCPSKPGSSSAFSLGAETPSFATHPGHGRVLSIRPADVAWLPFEVSLREAGYDIGRLPVGRHAASLAEAAATFQANIIYVTLAAPLEPCFHALEALASDTRTRSTPLVALLAEDADSQLVDQAYSCSGCDFFRLGATDIELLARTRLLVRLARANADGANLPVHEAPRAMAANNPPGGQRLDLYDRATGSHSRSYFLHRLPIEISRARRYGRALSLLVLQSSALADEACAATLARIIRDHVRTADLVARIREDRLAILLPETPNGNVPALRQRLTNDLTARGWNHTMAHAGLDDDGGNTTPAALLDAATSQLRPRS